ncbi:SGNH/GDSL hydrolase family protein [Phaeobacter gallaeciensis]|uniref:SGNH/GDSL hydrolase family protein n=3 Tax=Phaeobacter gallaeciensis TaxID=60890 RepID=UPI00237F9C08|nr:SGNH/GDSL hydrolase family protein [Phaeobacter gallaeciensis]MDE4193118.1 SGNH/GDSL hydrolase family protein [Phaeobacter gallaeciensis]MDE4201441.1 SGNH/GDSL hydrolase family protein [Phaeobacter gallaeciensis]MDE4205621.1 SGNH/GDSL hydrolase family protein [Phaeobacter gallaeciensis]MDE4209798.1 SGNH/GDSL hydrolase family protein [Phaeobacter gallaeciensis]MDE4218163.1 SGNH/GDSL hydrolase family protein [Phaeobacter gallaeciensis]
MKSISELNAINAADPIGVFDALLSAVAPRGEHKFYRGGYIIWPHPRAAEAAAHRLLTIGNSTSLWPDAAWSRVLAEKLTEAGLDVGLYHGAGKGNTSSQELLRVVRDAPAIAPQMIVSLSGITDIGYIINSKNYPFAHKYTRRVLDAIRAQGLSDEVSYGYPDPVTPGAAWLRNQRMSRVIAEDLGIVYKVFLQPVQGFGAYPMSVEEQAFFDTKSSVVLRAINKPYGVCVTEFYEEVRTLISEDPERHSHVIDITDAFADLPGAYRDHRHQSETGVERLAERMFRHVFETLVA